MRKSGGFLTLLIVALAVFTAVYLLLGDEMGSSTGSASYPELGGAAGEADPLTAAGLEAAGRRPPSPAEIAAAEAAARAAANAFPREEGLFGRVTDADSSPIGGATVQLLPDPPADRRRPGRPDDPPLATTTTDPEGNFLVGPAPATGAFKLRAEAPGYAPTLERVRERGARVDLVLDKGGALEVRILDGAGTAVPEATVVHIAGAVVSRASTDEGGHARFASLPTGTGSLVASKPGVGSVREQNLAVAPGETEHRTLVLPKGVPLAGVVNDPDKRPVSGAEVTLRYPYLHVMPPEGPVRTGEDGRFRLTAYASGQEQMTLRVCKEGFAEGRATINPTAKGELQVVLQRTGAAVEGRVTGSDRQPVGGVEVTFAHMQQEEPQEVPKTTSRDDGTFELALPAWAQPGWTLTLAATSTTQGVGAAQVKVPKPDAGPGKAIEIQLGGTGSVTGRVTDASGAAVQGALVSLQPDWSAARSLARSSPQTWLTMRVLQEGRGQDLSGVSGIDGTYLIPGVPALAYQVHAAYGLDQVTLPDSVTVAAGEVVEADIALAQGGTIEGVVRDSEERPVAGAYVSASPAQPGNNRMWWSNRPTGRSGSDGRFVLRGLGDQRYNVWATASGFGTAQEKNVSRGTQDVTLRMTARGWIRGVVYREGRPYRGIFTVVARSQQAGRPGSTPFRNFEGNWSGSRQQSRTFSTDDGRFEIRGLDPGEYTVQASTPEGLIAAQRDVVKVIDGRASREARLELQEGAVLRGTVRNDRSGEPIAGAWVYANARAGEAADASGATSGNGRTDAQGRYEIRGLGGGAYTLSVWTPGGSSFSTTLDLQSGEQRTLDLTEQQPGTIAFTVVDEQGAPLAGARPHIQSTNGNYINVNVQALKRDGVVGESYDWRALWETGADGTLLRHHVPPGTCTVWATLRGYKLVGERPAVPVASAATTAVRVVLKRTGGE